MSVSASEARKRLFSLIEEVNDDQEAGVLEDGRQLQVLNIAWGYDWQDEYAYVTTNCSPGVPGMSLDFFYTQQVIRVVGDDGALLYTR